MAQFVAFDPKVEVLGQALVTSTEGTGDEASVYLAAHSMGNIQPDQWYNQQEWLNFLKAINDHRLNAMFDLVGIGMKTPDNAIFPPQIDSIPSALASIDVAYHMNHRNGEIGHYHVNVLGDSSIDMLCENPYPCDFDYGLIYSMVRRFRPQNAKFSVVHDPNAPCRQKGADSCTYHITWDNTPSRR